MRAYWQEQYTNREWFSCSPRRATCLQNVTPPRSKFWNSGTFEKIKWWRAKVGRGRGSAYHLPPVVTDQVAPGGPDSVVGDPRRRRFVFRNSRRSWLVEATLVREYLGKCGINAMVNVPSRWPPYVPERTYRCPWRRQWCCRSASRRRVLHRRRNNPATWPRAALYSGRVRRN